MLACAYISELNKLIHVCLDNVNGNCLFKFQVCNILFLIMQFWLLTHVDLRAWFVECPSNWPQIERRRGWGSVRCHQFLHFKQTPGHRLCLQSLICSLVQTEADKQPLQMSTESSVADSRGKMSVTHGKQVSSSAFNQDLSCLLCSQVNTMFQSKMYSTSLHK